MEIELPEFKEINEMELLVILAVRHISIQGNGTIEILAWTARI